MAAGSLQAGQLRRALPAYVDDVTADFGDDLYDRMLVDAQVSACVSILKAAILEEGVALAPAVDDKAADGYARAVEIRDAAEAMLEDLATPLDDVLWDLLNSLAFGNRVAEQVYELGPGPDGRAILRLRALKVKPRRSTAFVVDRFMNVLGLLADVGGRGRASTSIHDVRPDEILPREKFAVLTFRPRDADPRGTSILRPAYDPWWRKRQVMVEYVKYLAQFAGPSLVGFTAEDAEDGVAEDGAPRTAEELMLEALLAFQNGTATVFGHGASVTPIEMQGDGKAFLDAVAGCNLEITKAVLTQQLATEEGQHQARAAAQVHQDVLDTLIRQGKRGVVRMLARDVLRTWVRWNWGDAAIPLAPIPSLGTTERRDVPALMSAIAALTRAGYPHPSQYPAIDALLGLPIRDLTATSEQAAPADDTGPDRDAADDDEDRDGDDPDDEEGAA